jgi:hypothetical protein
MGTSNKRCKVCNRSGAYAFNDYCSRHWQEQIDNNIKRIVAAQKKEPF